MVMTQLRHMVGAVRSDETQIEYQQYVAGLDSLCQVEYLTPVIRKGKIRRLVTRL